MNITVVWVLLKPPKVEDIDDGNVVYLFPEEPISQYPILAFQSDKEAESFVNLLWEQSNETVVSAFVRGKYLKIVNTGETTRGDLLDVWSQRTKLIFEE